MLDKLKVFNEIEKFDSLSEHSCEFYNFDFCSLSLWSCIRVNLLFLNVHA